MSTRVLGTALAAMMLAACGGEQPTGTDIDGANARTGGRGTGTGAGTGSTSTGASTGATTAENCNGTLGAITVHDNALYWQI